MSFMFNPLPYDDPTPVNKPVLPASALRGVTTSAPEAAEVLCRAALRKAEAAGSCILILDGYPGADFAWMISHCKAFLDGMGKILDLVDISAAYLPEHDMEELLTDVLPKDRVKDPVLLFGRLFDGGYEKVFDVSRFKNLVDHCQSIRNSGGLAMLYGRGSASAQLRRLCDLVVYFDVTPKQAALRAREGKVVCLGDAQPRPFKELMRRLYYVDFELAGKLRGELLQQDAIDFYIGGDPAHPYLLSRSALNSMMSALSEVPFRCRPVYLKGVWGGHYVNRLRKLPAEIGAVAWVFDLIPLEVSILVEAGENLLEFPFFTFVQKQGDAIMGADCVRRFGGYFPIRFNYDDTYHSSGNMSIQVHPPRDFCMSEFNELGGQDESYYVIATGHAAKTYCGLREDADVDRFFEDIRRSETEGTPVDHDHYVNSIPSEPGMQFMLPGGTVHASGRNQLILEIGSLTMGSYTFKLYDYLRSDLDGNRRPIHSWYGERVLARNRRAGWVRENLVKTPRLLKNGDGWAEYAVGETDLMYFCTRRLEFLNQMPGDTAGAFHVLTLVDGETVSVQSAEDPARSYTMNYLDVVVVPASLGRYILINRGNQPVVVHKTLLQAETGPGAGQ
jgi:mannose-6-phosphate isomerase